MSIAPAGVLDLIEVLQAAKKSPLPKRLYSALLVQVTTGRAWIVRGVHGEPLAIGGLYEIDGLPAQAWFVAVPDIGGRLPRVVLSARTVLRSVSPKCSAGVIAQVRKDNRAGERLARCLGFVVGDGVARSPNGSELSSVRIWERRNGSDGRKGFWWRCRWWLERACRGAGCRARAPGK